MLKLHSLLSVAAVLAASTLYISPAFAATIPPNQGATNPDFNPITNKGRLHPFECQGNGDVSASVVNVNDPLSNKKAMFIDASAESDDPNFSNAAGGVWTPVNLNMKTNTTITVYWKNKGDSPDDNFVLQVNGTSADNQQQIVAVKASFWDTTPKGNWNKSVITESVINDPSHNFGEAITRVSSISFNVYEGQDQLARFQFGDILYVINDEKPKPKQFQPTVNTNQFTPCPATGLTQGT